MCVDTKGEADMLTTIPLRNPSEGMHRCHQDIAMIAVTIENRALNAPES